MTSTREKINALQETMLEMRCEMPEAEHFFTPGVYGRRFAMSAGMLVVGKEHKHEHLMMVLSGCAEIVTEEGRIQVKGGDVFISPAGAKRVVLAIEDTTFMTIHHNPDNETDLEEIESQHIEDENFCLEYHKSIGGLLS